MAKYLAQIVLLGAQVVGRAFSRALRQEFAASQTAANQRRSNNGSNDRVINAKLGMNLQEAMQILNVENKDLSPELIEKNYKHLFDVNDKSKGGSFYIQSKKCVQNWKLMDSLRYHWNAFQTLSPIRGNQYNQMKTFLPIIPSNGLHTKDSNNIYEEAISEQNIQNCINVLQSIRVFRPKKSFTIGRSVRNAAVLVPFCRNADKEPSILLTQRSNNMSSHRGEVCFPGGIEEAHDNNQMIRTAVRETVEELGIDESRVKVYGVLNPFPASSGSAVHPVLGFIDLNDLDFNSNINREEVENVFIVPLKHLCDDTNWGFTKWKVGWTTPVYNDKSPDIPRVWGLTAGILYAVMSALLPNVVRAKERIDEELNGINSNDSTTSDQSFDKKQSENQ